jgi:hypothetical protein
METPKILATNNKLKQTLSPYNQDDIDAMNGPAFDNFAEILFAAYVEPSIKKEESKVDNSNLMLSIIHMLQRPEKPKPIPMLNLENNKLFLRRAEQKKGAFCVI